MKKSSQEQCVLIETTKIRFNENREEFKSLSKSEKEHKVLNVVNLIKERLLPIQQLTKQIDNAKQSETNNSLEEIYRSLYYHMDFLFIYVYFLSGYMEVQGNTDIVTRKYLIAKSVHYFNAHGLNEYASVFMA